MNVFHWHMTGWVHQAFIFFSQDHSCPGKDHQSFSFETKLSDDVYRHGENFKYSHENVKEIIEYARVRGIRARLNDTEYNFSFAHNP